MNIVQYSDKTFLQEALEHFPVMCRGRIALQAARVIFKSGNIFCNSHTLLATIQDISLWVFPVQIKEITIVCWAEKVAELLAREIFTSRPAKTPICCGEDRFGAGFRRYDVTMAAEPGVTSANILRIVTLFIHKVKRKHGVYFHNFCCFFFKIRSMHTMNCKYCFYSACTVVILLVPYKR